MRPIADPLKCLADAPLSHRPDHLSASISGEVIAVGSREGAVALLSGGLRVLGAREHGAGLGGLAVSPDGAHLGLSLRDRVCAMSARGEVVREIPHEPWPDWAGGGCAFSPDGRYFWSIRPSAEEGSVAVEVAECDGWTTTAISEFEAEEEGCWTLVPHPEGEVAGLWLGAGQDGQWLYWCGIRDGGLYIEEEPALRETGPPAFHPAGGEFLADGPGIGRFRRRRFPGGRAIGRISERDAHPPVPLVGPAGYVSDDRALVLAGDGRIGALGLAAMRLEGGIPLEGRPPRAHRPGWSEQEGLYGDVEQFLILPGGRLLAAHRDWIDRPLDLGGELRIWDASGLCRAMPGPRGDRPFTGAFFAHFLR